MARKPNQQEIEYFSGLTPFEQAKEVRRSMAMAAADAVIYRSWSDDFRLSQIREKNERLRQLCRGIPLDGLTTAECDELGFGRWSSETPLRLIPTWLYPHLRHGDVVTSFTGRSITVGDQYTDPDSGDGYVDNDARFGCLAFGIIPADAQVSA
jgi:hypothetical protein